MTPLFPHSFLLLATLANVGKNISWLAGSATRAGIRYGFVNAHNMGDITAKEGSQTVAITVFGTFLGIVISNLIGHGHMEYVLMSSMCISAVSLFSIYRSLRCVSLPTLNYQVGLRTRGYSQRGEIVTSHYLDSEEILPPETVASMERFYLPYLKVKGQGIPIVVGTSLRTTLSRGKSMKEMREYLELFEGCNYVVSLCDYVRKGRGSEE